jgi:hypothetical protein
MLTVRFVYVFFALMLIWVGAPLWAQETAVETAPTQAYTTAIKPFGFVDTNGDGINDRFRDADGNGVNDRTGLPYPHHFGFADKNGNRVNDLYIDRDGDGVNDLSAAYADSNGDGHCDNIVDYNGDRRNDVTGLHYKRFSLHGYRYGFIDEERGVKHRRFIDENGDGMHDHTALLPPPFLGNKNKMDYFIDEDGDGIIDGRRLRAPQRPIWPDRDPRRFKGRSPRRPPRPHPAPRR